MDYTRLRKIAQEGNVSLRQLAAYIGMTQQGFFKALRNDTMQIKALEKCAERLNCSVCDFFECGTNPGQSPDAALRDKYYKAVERTNELLEENIQLRSRLRKHETI